MTLEHAARRTAKEDARENFIIVVIGVRVDELEE